MRAVVAAMLILAACGGGPEPGWTLEGEVVSMEVRTVAKRPQGQPARQEVVVQVAPASVSREGTPRPESEWAPALSEHRRRDTDRYEFSIDDEPLPAVLPAGANVRLVLDSDGYLIAFEPVALP